MLPGYLNGDSGLYKKQIPHKTCNAKHLEPWTFKPWTSYFSRV